MLQFVNVSKKYGENESLKNSSFQIHENEIIGLIGPNGAGKSTTMKLMVSLAEPTSGEVLYNNQRIDTVQKELQKNIGYLPEIPPLYDDMTVFEYLSFVCDIKLIEKEFRNAEIERVMGCLSLVDMRFRLIKNLSKGYKQRVGFAGAIIGKPKLLILDEPTVGLDPQQIIDIRNLIIALSKDMSIVISSHILSEISEVCTRLIIMKKGNIVADGKKEDILAKYNKDYIVELEFKSSKESVAKVFDSFSGKAEIKVKDESVIVVKIISENDIREEIYNCIKKSNLMLLKMNSVSMSLEDIFITLTK